MSQSCEISLTGSPRQRSKDNDAPAGQQLSYSSLEEINSVDKDRQDYNDVRTTLKCAQTTPPDGQLKEVSTVSELN